MVVLHVWFIGLKGQLREIAGKNKVRPLFLLTGFFLFSRHSEVWFWGLIFWHLWIGRAKHLGPVPPSHHFALEVFNVGGWLTHGDLAFEAGVDFLAVVEHRLIPARVRSEWTRQKGKGLASVWALACQDSSHVGPACVGVISTRGAPVSLPTFATAQFRLFFECGRALRCMLPVASCRFLHLVVLYGYQGADADAQQLALTEQLLDAAMGELGVVARGQPCMLVGDCNVEPTKIPCLAKGISAKLWVDLEEAWALAAGLRPAVTCKKAWDSAGGHRREWLVVLLRLLLFFLAKFRMIGGLPPILLFAPCLTAVGGLVLLHSLSSVPPFGLLLGCLLLMKAGVPSLLRFGGFGTFMMSVFSLCLVVMFYCWMTPSLMVMFLGLGLFGLVLLSLLLLMLIGSVVVLFPVGV